MYNAFNLTDEVAITTWVSSGLGIGIAHALAQAGADIVAAARTSCAEIKSKVNVPSVKKLQQFNLYGAYQSVFS
ncbi:MAG: hypothetical protein RSD08_09675 [Oscillospiraceae bacterium]